jgi:hypothetical protein
MTLDDVTDSITRCDRCQAEMALYVETLWITDHDQHEMLRALLKKLHLLCPSCAAWWRGAGRPWNVSQ